MYTEQHVVALLAIISEQRTRITDLEADLDAAKKTADRNWRWYLEEEEKAKKLSGELALLSTQLNQPRI